MILRRTLFLYGSPVSWLSDLPLWRFGSVVRNIVSFCYCAYTAYSQHIVGTSSAQKQRVVRMTKCTLFLSYRDRATICAVCGTGSLISSSRFLPNNPIKFAYPENKSYLCIPKPSTHNGICCWIVQALQENGKVNYIYRDEFWLWRNLLSLYYAFS